MAFADPIPTPSAKATPIAPKPMRKAARTISRAKSSSHRARAATTDRNAALAKPTRSGA